MHITTGKGMTSRGEKAHALAMQLLSFSAWKKCSLSVEYTPGTQMSFILATSFHCPLLLWLWMLLLCFWLTLFSLHSQNITAHQCPVVLRCPPAFGCTTDWKNSCHLLSPSCQAMPFSFPSFEHLQVGGHPASCLSVEWGRPWDA